MKTRSTVLITLLLVLNTPLLFAAEAGATYAIQSIEDGDTLIVELDGKSERIQLLGIDAPENAENPKLKHDIEQSGLSKAQLLELGDAATQYLQTLVSVGDSVALGGDLDNKDRYGRILARVSNSDGQGLGDAMVQAGYAIALPRSQFPQQQEYVHRLDRLERFSRKSNNGLWGSHRELARAWYDRTR